jgi:hydroxymethylglutaryl-CoA synthase
MPQAVTSQSAMVDVTDVGIAGFAFYVPRACVPMTELEAFDNVPRGRYTLGLGQVKMAVPHECEDAASMAMTVVQRLAERYDISFNDIGRLEIGTESRIDKSKSVKTSLMQLFEKSGNVDCEGLDNTNACYGSTAALLNTAAWVESSSWDGRYGVVVGSDIAVYEPGPARPTGGAGAVAILIGRGTDCPIRFETGLRASCFGNSYDFYKPFANSEYPRLNGAKTVDCFFRAMDSCYKSYKNRFEKRTGGTFRFESSVDYFCCHSPFYKLVKRSLARLVYLDFIEGTNSDMRDCQLYKDLHAYRDLAPETSHQNKEASRAFVAATEPLFKVKCDPGAWLARHVGNAYTASLYGALAALLHREGDKMLGSRILLFAFGSGFASTMYSLRVVGSLETILASLFDLESSLDERHVLSGEEYDAIMLQREKDYKRFDYSPSVSPGELFAGTYFVTYIGANGERHYGRSAPLPSG